MTDQSCEFCKNPDNFEWYDKVEVGSKTGYPGSALSNFSPHPFVFDGVPCASMEGLLQSFKFDKTHIQEEVCKLTGFAAKKRGQARNKAWKQAQTLWWKGKSYHRDSDEYQYLLDTAYKAMYEQSEGFRKALAATGKATLTHAIGRNKTNETILTQREFCSRLENLRDGRL